MRCFAYRAIFASSRLRNDASREDFLPFANEYEVKSSSSSSSSVLGGPSNSSLGPASISSPPGPVAPLDAVRVSVPVGEATAATR